MMVPMPELVPSAEAPAMRRRVRTDVDDGAVPIPDDLRFAVRKSPVLHLDAHTMRDRLQLDIRRIRDAKLRKKLFGGAHAVYSLRFPSMSITPSRKAIWRIDQTAPEGRYALDNTGRISEMRDRAFAEAREQLPDLKRHFFGAPADEFVPFHTL